MSIINQPTQPQAPFLSAIDLERIAYQTLQKFDQSLLSEPQALNIERFAEQFLRLNLDFIELTNNQSILGIMVFSESPVPIFDPEINMPRIINVNAGTAIIERTLLDNRNQNRTRFTIAHECAHWLLHRPKTKSQPLICRTVGSSDPKNWQEWQADNLASALLMPAVAVNAFMKKYVRDNRESMKMMYQMFGDRYAKTKREQIIRIAAATFAVSEQAAELRLTRLHYLKPKPESLPDLLGFECINPMTQMLFGDLR